LSEEMTLTELGTDLKRGEKRRNRGEGGKASGDEKGGATRVGSQVQTGKLKKKRGLAEKVREAEKKGEGGRNRKGQEYYSETKREGKMQRLLTKVMDRRGNKKLKERAETAGKEGGVLGNFTGHASEFSAQCPPRWSTCSQDHDGGKERLEDFLPAKCGYKLGVGQVGKKKREVQLNQLVLEKREGKALL